MDTQTRAHAQHVMDALTKRLLPGARELLGRLTDGDIVAKTGGAFGDPANDTELKADKELGRFLGNNLADMIQVAHVSVEGLADVATGREGLWVTVDPLDGSLNYRDRGPTMGLPFTACVTVLSRKDGATFDDIVGAAVIDLRNGDLWHTAFRPNGSLMTIVNGVPAEVHTGGHLDPGQMVIIFEPYYVENRDIVVSAFQEFKKGWFRSPGSAAYEMACVASGQAAAQICRTQKQHELGAGYALVKGAGGIGFDWDGKDLGPRPYDFQTQTPVVLANNTTVAQQIIDRLQAALEARGMKH